MRSVIAALKLSTFLLWCALTMPIQVVFLWLAPHSRVPQIIPVLYHRFLCAVFGLRYEVVGTPLNHGGLMTGNHLSYLDIIILSAATPVSFVAKLEVASWPLFGWLAKLQRTVFVERRSVRARDGAQAIQQRMKDGYPLALFAEGTSTDGIDVLPFKSSLFASVLNQDINQDIPVQPFTIALLTVGGRAADTPAIRNLYCWHGNMELLPHLWAFAKTSGAGVRLTFHPPHKAQDFADRKALSAACHADCLSGLPALLSKTGVDLADKPL